MMHLDSALCHEVYTVCGTCHFIFPKDFCQVISEDGSVSTNVSLYFLAKTYWYPGNTMWHITFVSQGSQNRTECSQSYCYQSLGDGLQGLASRGLLDDCEHWRTRTAPANLMARGEMTAKYSNSRIPYHIY